MRAASCSANTREDRLVAAGLSLYVLRTRDKQDGAVLQGLHPRWLRQCLPVATARQWLALARVVGEVSSESRQVRRPAGGTCDVAAETLLRGDQSLRSRSLLHLSKEEVIERLAYSRHLTTVTLVHCFGEPSVASVTVVEFNSVASWLLSPRTREFAGVHAPFADRTCSHARVTRP